MSPQREGSRQKPQCVIAAGLPCSWGSEKSCGGIAPVKPKERRERSLPSFAESHGCKPVDECEVGPLSVASAPGLRSRSGCFGRSRQEGTLRLSPSEVGYSRRRSEGSAL